MKDNQEIDVARKEMIVPTNSCQKSIHHKIKRTKHVSTI
jgi:hypothetical protein